MGSKIRIGIGIGTGIGSWVAAGTRIMMKTGFTAGIGTRINATTGNLTGSTTIADDDVRRNIPASTIIISAAADPWSDR